MSGFALVTVIGVVAPLYEGEDDEGSRWIALSLETDDDWYVAYFHDEAAEAVRSQIQEGQWVSVTGKLERRTLKRLDGEGAVTRSVIVSPSWRHVAPDFTTALEGSPE